MNRALWFVLFLSASLRISAQDRTGEVQEIAPGVYFHQGDIDAGAIPVAYEGVIEEAERYEPERWNGVTRDDVLASELVLPILRFSDKLVFDDGTRRVELLHLGVSHTHGDGWAWLPEERILFSGDAARERPA